MTADIGLLRQLLGDRRIIYKRETGSTNTDLAQGIAGGEYDVGDVIIADSQNAGRGRRSKSFLSPEGGIYFSFCVNNIEYGLSTVICGVSVTRVLEKSGLVPSIKWVNDILLDEKKVCGILAQAVGDGRRAVMGVGINVFEKSIPDELKDIATALDRHTKSEICREKIIADVIATYEELSEINIKEGPEIIIKEYSEKMMLTDREITVVETGENLIARGVASDGALLAQRADGTIIALSSGEISVRRVK